METNFSFTAGTTESDSTYAGALANVQFEDARGSNSVQAIVNNSENTQLSVNAGEDNSENAQKSRRRGRPRGAKNKPKVAPTLYIGSDSDDSLMPHVLEIAPGGNVISALSGFYQRLRVGGLCVMSGRGMVSDVTIWRAGSATYFPGTFEILSFSGSILPHCSFLFIALAGPQLAVIGGNVEGVLRAAGPVYVIAASCPNANPVPSAPPLLDSNGYTPSSDLSIFNESSNAINYEHQPDDLPTSMFNISNSPSSF